MFLVLALVVLGVFITASLVNYADQNTRPGSSVTEVRADSLCKSHNWKQITIVLAEDLEKLKADPSLISDMRETYCTNCGFIPSKNVMLSPKHLELANTEVAFCDEQNERHKQFETLRDQFLNDFLEMTDYTSEQKALFRRGFDHYDRFVGVFPELYEAKKQERKKGEFE